MISRGTLNDFPGGAHCAIRVNPKGFGSEQTDSFVSALLLVTRPLRPSCLALDWRNL